MSKPIDKMDAQELRIEIAKERDNADDCTTNIADAWKLVEEFIDGYDLSFDKERGRHYRFHGIGTTATAYGDTAPLAICRAWLKWKRG